MTSRDETSLATRAAILQAAATLFRTKGLRHTTVRGIARAAGYSTGAIFSHWTSKDDIWREVMGVEPPDLHATPAS